MKSHVDNLIHLFISALRSRKAFSFGVRFSKHNTFLALRKLSNNSPHTTQRRQDKRKVWMRIQYFIVITETFEQSIIMLRYYVVLLRFIVQLLYYIYVHYVNRSQYFLLPSALIICLRLAAYVQAAY